MDLLDGTEEQHDSPELFMFLASTAHDMKNSISVLCCTLEHLLVDGSAKTAAAYPQMAHMLYETKRLNNNLIQLLALYKEVGKPAYPFDPNTQIMSDFVDTVRAQNRVLLESKNIAFEVDVDPDQDWYFDEDLIVGVIGHAINNAVHYTLDKIRLAISVQENTLEIRVEDNGRGYPQGMLDSGNAAMSGDRAGVSFATNSTGLGLYFSSEVAKMHKNRGRCGSVRLENGGVLGGGCFVLRLP
ncbi:MAG: HAMP domain-containing histidine kinase [Burkholderiales bacterium]|nr:HAMP domain-containing histidine kinase [Burkholderiales bacterium]